MTSSRVVWNYYHAKKLVLKSFPPSKTTRLLPVYRPYTRQIWKSGSDLVYQGNNLNILSVEEDEEKEEEHETYKTKNAPPIRGA